MGNLAKDRPLALLLLLVLSACAGGGAVDPTPTPAPDPLLEIIRENRAAAVVVQLAVPRGSAGSWDTAAISKAQRQLVRSLGSTGFRVVDRFGRKQPLITLLVEEDALTKLRASPLVVDITLNQRDG